MTIEPGKELLWKAALGHLEEKDVPFFKTWLEASPENLNKFNQIKKWVELNSKEASNDPIDNPPHGNGPQTPQRSQNYLVAAIMLIFAALGLLIYFLLKK